MLYLFLLIIIVLLIYIAFFSPEKRDQREVKRVQNLFNTPLYPSAVDFTENDDRNASHPDEIVKFGITYISRKKALARLANVRKEHPDADEELVQTLAKTKLD